MDSPAPLRESINAMTRSYKEGAKDGKLSVRRNFKSALVHFRHKRKAKILWIDALCINQSNLEERSQQVVKMRRLYVSAQTMSVWLGDGTTETPVPGPCFDFLNNILDLQNPENLLRELEGTCHSMSMFKNQLENSQTKIGRVPEMSSAWCGINGLADVEWSKSLRLLAMQEWCTGKKRYSDPISQMLS